MKTLSSYGETLSPYLKSSNPATVISTESKLSEIDVLWIKICNNQELKKIFQYGNLQTIWKNVNYMEQVVDEFCDSRDSDHYRNISQYLWNYEIYLQANKIVKSDEKIELISKIKYISKCFGSKTSRHGNVLSSRIGGNNSNGSRDNTNMSKAKVNNCENEEQSKQPQDAKQRALKIVEAKVAEDEKTQRALRGREHDEKKKEIEIKLDGIEKKRNEIKQEIYKFVGTTSDPKLHELSEYSVRLILEMDDLNLPRGSDLHTRKIKMLKEVYQYSDILAKKAMENEFVQIETYIAHFEENFEYFTKSENLGECRDGIENIKMRLRGINASVGLEERKSKCMEVTNNMQEILETIEYADRSKREEESTISSEQIEKNDAKMPNNELTKDGGNCEIASKSLEYSIGLKDHGLSNIERKEEELDYIEKVIPDYDPQEIIGKFKQLSLDNRGNTSRSMDLINETKKLEGEASDKNERSASLSDKLGNGSLGIIAKLKKTIFESFERKIQNINEKIHSAHSCGQCDALKEELIKLDAQLEPYIFKNGDAVKRNELRRTIHDSMNFVENRRESLAVIENELKSSSETHL
ncbi:hypothetical protein JTB14_002663 [Gonioctena quinquepunctata]|nr:hypothetical protein JTB14_002663 [Gonioctena quinquepunctata]